MKLSEVFGNAEEVTTSKAAGMMKRHPNSVRSQLHSGRLVGRQIGREWVIPVIYDDDGEPVFLWRPQRKGE